MRDLETSEMRELLDWAASLDLSTRGSRRRIEDRILDYYGVPRSGGDSVASTDTALDTSLASIERASGSEVFTIEAAKEDYLTLRGGVVLTMESNDRDHRISADMVTFNITNNSISASGNVTYTVDGPSGVEEFTGDSIVFQLDTWEGVFLSGVTSTSDDESGNSFFVSGERISRAPNEVIVIDHGTITSSTADPPNFRISATRVWLLAPGEWGIKHAVLYVGTVPVFYFPYFFIPADKIVFHPVTGSSDRSGSYIQTTTYFFGASEESKPPLSIMQLADTAENTKRVREGIYLRLPDEPVEPDPNGWSLKLMADYYSTQGVYAGVAGTHPDLGPFRTLDYRLGLAKSQTVFTESNGYTNFYTDDDGTAHRHWDEGYLLGRTVPFRYEAEASLFLSIDRFSFKVDSLFLSDPVFRQDFADRKESFDWSFILNSGTGESSSSSATSISSLRWSAELGWTPNLRSLSPWIQSFSITRFRSDLLWNTATTAEDLLPSVVRENTVDRYPGSTYFYPSSATAPDIALSVRGTLIDWNSSSSFRTPERGDSSDTSPTLRPPWESEERSEAEGEKDDLLPPDTLPDLEGLPLQNSTSIMLQYQFNPSMNIDYVPDYEGWESPEDLEWSWKFGTRTQKLRSGLTLTSSLPDTLMDTTTSLTLDTRRQVVQFDNRENSEDREELILAGYRYDSAILSHTSTVTLRPVSFVDRLKESTLSWSLSNTLFTHDYEESSSDFVDSWFNWSEEVVQSHSVNANWRASTAIGDQALSLQAVIPPLDPRYSGTLNSVLGPLTTTLSGGMKKENDTWIPETLQQSHTLSILDSRFTLSEQIIYDLEAMELTRSNTNVNAGILTMSLVARETRGYFFDPNSGWIADENEQFQFTTFTAGLALDTDQVYLWKNRIRLNLFADANLSYDMLRFTNSSLNLSYGLSLHVHEFLDLELSARTRNNYVYQYLGPLAERIGRTPRNLVVDIVHSLAVWNRTNLEETFFKLQSVNLIAVHDLEDWELRVAYSGGPELDTSESARVYRWNGILTVLVQWKSIEELKRNFEINDATVEFLD